MYGRHLITLYWIHSIQSSQAGRWSSIDSSYRIQTIRLNEFTGDNGCPSARHIPLKPFDAMDVHQLTTSHSNHSIQSNHSMQWMSIEPSHLTRTIPFHQFIQCTGRPSTRYVPFNQFDSLDVSKAINLYTNPHNPFTPLDPINSHNTMGI